MNADYYLNKEKVQHSRKTGIIMGIVGFAFFLFFLLSVIALNVAFLRVPSEWPIVLAFCMPYIIISYLFFLLFWRGMLRNKAARKAEQYALFFAGLKNGYAAYQDVAVSLGKKTGQVQKDLLDLIKRGLLQHVMSPGTILLEDHGRFWKQYIYLNRNGIRESEGKAWFLQPFCLFFGAIGLSSVLMLGWITLRGDYSFLSLLGMEILITAACIMGIVRMMADRRLFLRAELYNGVLERNTTPEILLDRIGEMTGLPESRVRKDFLRLMKLNVLQNCVLRLKGKPAVRLSDIIQGKASFAAIQCPNCGSTSRVRIGRTAECPYCGRILAAPLAKSGNTYYVMAGAKEGWKDQQAFEAHGTNKAVRILRLQHTDAVQRNPFVNEKNVQKMNNRKIAYFTAAVFLFLMAGSQLIFTLSTLSGSMHPIMLAFELGLCAMYAVPGYLLLKKGFRWKNIQQLADRLAALFRQSFPSSWTLEELTEYFHLEKTSDKKNLKSVLQKNLLDYCTFSEDRAGVVSLTDPSHRQGAYLHVLCPHCSAAITIKRGVVSRCEYCGAYLDEHGVLHVSETTGD